MTALAAFKQADIERAAKAVRKAGWQGGKIIIDPATNRMEIVLGGQDDLDPIEDEWDLGDG